MVDVCVCPNVPPGLDEMQTLECNWLHGRQSFFGENRQPIFKREDTLNSNPTSCEHLIIHIVLCGTGTLVLVECHPVFKPLVTVSFNHSIFCSVNKQKTEISAQCGFIQM